MLELRGDKAVSYILDGVGNWVSQQTDSGPQNSAVGYAVDAMNAYTRIGNRKQAHDANGSLLTNEAVEKPSEMPKGRKSGDRKTPPQGEIIEYRASQGAENFPRS